MDYQRWSIRMNKFALLPVIFGILTTISHYLGYGVSDQIEQLPLILRALDSNFLQNDFFTNEGINSVARHYYAIFISTLAGSERYLPLVFLLLTFLANISISVITFHFAQNIFNNNQMAGIFASALVMSVSTYKLGWLSVIYQKLMIPSSIAIPLILWAVSNGLRGNHLIGTVLCCIASIIHPLFGIEVGGLLLLTFIAFHIITKQEITRESRNEFLLSAILLTSFSLILIIPYFSQSKIDSNLFINIIAYFRHPHHYVPSSFGFLQYCYMVAFSCVAYLGYYRKRKTLKNSTSLNIVIMGSIVIFLCVGGYIFTELIPSRIWVIAQPFRLLFIFKWIGIILIAGSFVDKKIGTSTKALYLVSLSNPIFLGAAVLSQSIREWLIRHQNRFSKFLNPFLILLIALFLFIYLPIPKTSVFLLSCFILLILAFNTLSTRLLLPILLIGSILLIMTGIFHSHLPYLKKSGLITRISRNLEMDINSQLGQEGDEIVEFVLYHTSSDSVFLTPPMWGQFRLLAKRAIVVDFKAFPFTDSAMLEWYKRITDCYGYPAVLGGGMIAELDRNYKELNDDILITLKEKYNISYAVLYKQSSTHFKVIFENTKYKVVDLNALGHNIFDLNTRPWVSFSRIQP